MDELDDLELLSKDELIEMLLARADAGGNLSFPGKAITRRMARRVRPGTRPNRSGTWWVSGWSHGAWARERPPFVRTLDPAPLDLVATVAKQDEFHALWLTERSG